MSTAEIQQQLAAALELCQRGAFGDAERVYRTLVETHPDTPDAWNMLGTVLYQQGRIEEAAAAAVRATELRPAIAPYWLMRGNAALALGAYREAQESFGRAVKIAPDFAEAHYRLGLAFHGELLCVDAVKAYRAALRYAPQVAEIHWQLAEALIALGQTNEAMRAYQDAFAADPDGTLDRRGCFEWLGRLHFETLPAPWHHELERFFERANVDKQPYVRAGLNALKTKPAFRAALAAARAPVVPLTIDAALRDVLEDRLFGALLRDCLMQDVEFERLLTQLRAALVHSAQARARTPFGFLCDLALQNLNNEFVHVQDDAETAAVASLAADVERALKAPGEVPEQVLRDLAVVACYRRLHEQPGIDRLLQPPPHSARLRTLLERSVVHVRAEAASKAQIPVIASTEDETSRAVRGMYEEHPYPRWFAVDTEPPFSLSEWIARELPHAPRIAAPAAPRVLVAGCGTGRDAIWLASNLANAQVLGVDLSLSSLAYARRMASALHVANIELAQGDILALGDLGRRFDLIASTGVLHHMRDPLAGLRSIAKLLAPGGVMKLGFYSSRARTAVTASRRIIAAEGMAATEAEIRRFRQRVFASAPGSPLKVLEVSGDFYSMSMCRDLLFHVQEHQYTLPQIGAMLDDVGLELLGLAELPQDAVFGYRRMFPSDRAMSDIANWDAYEREHPDTFGHMFLLWCWNRSALA